MGRAIGFVIFFILVLPCPSILHVLASDTGLITKVIDGDTVELSSVVGARCNVPLHWVIFPDGRALLFGTQDTSLARTLYSQYVGL